MFELIRTYQLDIMFALIVACLVFAFLLFVTDFLDKKRKIILIAMEFIAAFLLFFDRMAYVYSGDVTDTGYVMVRVSNFFVFFLTAVIIFVFNIYIIHLLDVEGHVEKFPMRLNIVAVLAIIEMALVILSQFTGLYYYFDDMNVYHRGAGFLLCYIVPVVCPIIQYTVIVQYRKRFTRFTLLSLTLYIFVPIIFGIIQIFTYGLSLVNMAMVLVSISLYILTYLDVNKELVHAHKIEMGELEEEKGSMKRLFDQTATAFVTAVEKKDKYSQGHSKMVADYARRIAIKSGMNEEESDEVYYTALLHDVGMIGIPDELLDSPKAFTDEEYEIIKRKPVESAQILSCIDEYPYLREGVLYCQERYDGKGYPEGLKGKDIPEIARIVAVADAYASMTTDKRYSKALPYQTVREEFVEEAGSQFDPKYADIMVALMDEDHEQSKENAKMELEKEIICDNYKEKVTVGIPAEQEIKKIHFVSEPLKKTDGSGFSAPSIIIFDSYDRRVHGSVKAVDVYRYLEYGELWFDGRYVSTDARDIDVRIVLDESEGDLDYQNKTKSEYDIVVARAQDHVSIRMISQSNIVEAIIALPDKAKPSYIGITGENCRITGISVIDTGVSIKANDIKRIADEEKYTDRLESDIPNVQIDNQRSDYTEGIRLYDYLSVDFHTKSLPSSSLAWHCPYVLLYSSDDGTVNGDGYIEYALIKIHGEASFDKNNAENKFYMKKKDKFPGWEEWKKVNKKGMECEVELQCRKNKIILMTENLGIRIENETIVSDSTKPVYVALTGDQVALTDIRIRDI